MPDASYLPIAQHGLIGDLRTCALVGSETTIDWFCAPRFDSPSIFGSLLDPEKGGFWRLEPVGAEATTSQFYFPDSNILVTRLMTEQGVAEVHDFMPLVKAGDEQHRQRIVRRVVAVRGRTHLRMTMAARPDYGRITPDLEQTDHGVCLTGGGLRLGLTATTDLVLEDGVVTAEVSLEEDDTEALFCLEVLADGPGRLGGGRRRQRRPVPADRGLLAQLDQHVDVQGALARDGEPLGTHPEAADPRADRRDHRLADHQPPGVDRWLPQLGLPLRLGARRGLQPLRPAAAGVHRRGLGLHALALRADGEGRRPASSVRSACSTTSTATCRTSRSCRHLAGYRDSRPVRIGNGAVDQLQLDIYGELIDSVYLFNKYGKGISAETWGDLTRALEWLLDNWDEPDAGMWEIRNDPRHHTTSLLMCWVAIERMMRVARQRGLPGELSRWAEVRDEIYHRIMEDHWDEEVGAFMQHAGADTLDAGVLLMPMVKFLSPSDPRFLSTLAVIEERLVYDSLVFRYDLSASPDGVDGVEGTFSLCSFWYVEALTRAGRLDDARLALEKMFTYANHLGLYAEQIGLTGEQLGNFPQAFTHLSLISAAINLDRELG